MQGIELCEKFYHEYGAPMLKEQFPQLLPLIAVGLAGSGSECFGFDDEISRDHDFEPGFCIFLPGEELVDSRTAFALERAYAKLPREYMGFVRSPLSPVGGNRHGVLRTADFLRDKTGTPDGRLSARDWFFLPEQSLAEAANGKLFHDGSGEMTAARERLAYLPEDIRIKKLAGELLLMGQSGQYNYPRCTSRGDSAAAQLCVVEFVKSALHAALLLGGVYLPYYKWQFRALRNLPELSELAAPLEYLLTSANTEGEAAKKRKTVETVAARLCNALREQDLSRVEGETLEAHAYAVNDCIRDGEIRNLHILYGV